MMFNPKQAIELGIITKEEWQAMCEKHEQDKVSYHSQDLDCCYTCESSSYDLNNDLECLDGVPRITEIGICDNFKPIPQYRIPLNLENIASGKLPEA